MSRTVKIKKSELVLTLQKNREEHIEAFNEALKTWSADITKISGELAATPLSEKVMQQLTKTWHDKPKSYEDSYDSALLQMEMDTRDEIELELQEFDELIRDKWDWMRSFGANTYSSVSNARVKSR